MKATLEDLELELWLRRRNAGSLQWQMRDGTSIPVKDMSDRHLLNSINMLRDEARSREEYMDALAGYPDSFDND